MVELIVRVSFVLSILGSLLVGQHTRAEELVGLVSLEQLIPPGEERREETENIRSFCFYAFDEEESAFRLLNPGGYFLTETSLRRAFKRSRFLVRSLAFALFLGAGKAGEEDLGDAWQRTRALWLGGQESFQLPMHIVESTANEQLNTFSADAVASLELGMQLAVPTSYLCPNSDTLPLNLNTLF